MSLQIKTITRYRQLFPGETLREVSARTGIQITRVFRLFGGKTMKVGELEAFESAITARMAENPNYARLYQTLENASVIMTNEELGLINDYIERKISVRTYSRLYISSQFNEANIA